MKGLHLWLARWPLLCFCRGGTAMKPQMGLMCPLTGKWASKAGHGRASSACWWMEANSKGGVNGQKSNWWWKTTPGIPVRRLWRASWPRPGVVAVIGTYGSAVTEASQNILDEAGLVQIGTGSATSLTEKGLPLFFRTCPRDDAQGKSAAAAIAKGGYKAVALLHDNSSYAKGLAEETRTALEKAGVKVIFYDALTPGERDYTAILTKLKAAGPDLVFFTGYYPETGMLLRQKKEMGWNVPMMGGDAANHQDLVKIAGPEAAAGYFFISPPLPQDMDMPEARNFLTAYKAKYNSVPVSVWAVLAGDAFKVIEAALAAGKTEPEQMAAWLKQLKDMPGLSGALGFDAKGDRVGEFYRTYVVDGKGLSFCNPITCG